MARLKPRFLGFSKIVARAILLSALVLSSTVLTQLALTPSALAQSADAPGDGAYGRLQTEFIVEAGLGAGVVADAAEPDLRWTWAMALELRARYLDMAGLMLGVEPRFEGGSRLLLAADLRPLFLGRFLSDLSLGDRRLDLLVDSIGIDLGVAFFADDGRVGAAFAFGAGVDLPLFFADSGPEALSLRLSGRYVSANTRQSFGPSMPVDDWFLQLSWVFRTGTSLGLSTWERPRYTPRR